MLPVSGGRLDVFQALRQSQVRPREWRFCRMRQGGCCRITGKWGVSVYVCRYVWVCGSGCVRTGGWMDVHSLSTVVALSSLQAPIHDQLLLHRRLLRCEHHGGDAAGDLRERSHCGLLRGSFVPVCLSAPVRIAQRPHTRRGWLRGESRCTRISTTTRAASTTTPTWYVPHAPGSAAPPDVYICAYVRASDGRCRRIRLNVHVGDVQSVRTDQPRGADRGLGHRERCGLLDREEQLGLDLG